MPVEQQWQIQQSQILDKIANRARKSVNQSEPSLTLFSSPVRDKRSDRPDSLIMDPSEIYKFMRQYHRLIPFNPGEIDFGTRKVNDGVCFMGHSFYYEINQHGIVYYGEQLVDKKAAEQEQEALEEYDIIQKIYKHSRIAREFYKEGRYIEDSDRIEIMADLRCVEGWIIKSDYMYDERIPSVESNVCASIRCSLSDLWDTENVEKYADAIIELSKPLFWIFNLESDEWQRTWRHKLTKWLGS